MTGEFEKRVEISVQVPEDASPEEEQRLIDEAVDRELDSYIDGTIDEVLKNFGR